MFVNWGADLYLSLVIFLSTEIGQGRLCLEIEVEGEVEVKKVVGRIVAGENTCS